MADRTAIHIKINRLAGLASVALFGFLVQDHFKGLEVSKPWRLVVIGLLVAALVVLVLTWEPVYKRTVARFPYVMVRRGSSAALASSDIELREETLREVAALGRLLGEHVRYAPMRTEFGDADTLDDIRARSWQRSQEHAQRLAGQFFDDHYEIVVSLGTRLKQRGVFDNEEFQELLHYVGTAAMPIAAHDLVRVGPLLARGAHRLATR